MSWLPFKQFLRHPMVVGAFERAAFKFFKNIPKTTKLIIEPPNVFELIDDYWPCIFATWHGQSYLLPFAYSFNRPVHVLASGSFDGQIFARAARQLGLNVIQGSASGKTSKHIIRKNSLSSFYRMRDVLNGNSSVALTADIPQRPGIAGMGIIKLAQISHRPIVPIGVMTSHRIRIPTRDRTLINMPYGRLVITAMEPVNVPDVDDPRAIETKRLEIEQKLNAANARATRLAAYWRETAG